MVGFESSTTCDQDNSNTSPSRMPVCAAKSTECGMSGEQFFSVEILGFRPDGSDRFALLKCLMTLAGVGGDDDERASTPYDSNRRQT